MTVRLKPLSMVNDEGVSNEVDETARAGGVGALKHS